MISLVTVYLGGVAGVGKSTFLGEIMDEISTLGYKTVSMGSLMLEEATRKGYATSRDELSHLSREIREELHHYAVDRIGELSWYEDLIVDSHYMVRTSYGFEEAISPQDLDTMGIDMLFLLEAEPETVYRRRQQDKSRDRGQYSIDDIEEELHLEERYAEYLSTSGIPLVKLSSEDREKQRSHNIFVSYLEVLKGIDFLRSRECIM